MTEKERRQERKKERKKEKNTERKHFKNFTSMPSTNC